MSEVKLIVEKNILDFVEGLKEKLTEVSLNLVEEFQVDLMESDEEDSEEVSFDTLDEETKQGFVEYLIQEGHDLESMDEEALNELSKKTLGSYVKKSKAHDNKILRDLTKDQREGRSVANFIYMRDHGDKVAKTYKTLQNRRDGVQLATKKLSEEQLNELSKKTLGSYVKKANIQAINAADRFGQGDGAKHLTKVAKRIKGVDKAVNKLTEEQLQEASFDQAVRETLDALKRSNFKGLDNIATQMAKKHDVKKAELIRAVEGSNG